MNNKINLHQMFAFLTMIAIVFLLSTPFWLSLSLLCFHNLVTAAFSGQKSQVFLFFTLSLSALSIEFNGLKRFFENPDIEIITLIFSIILCSFFMNFLLKTHKKSREIN